MVKKSVEHSDVRNVSSASEFQRISLTVKCSAPKSKWTAKWTSLFLFSKFGRPTVNASLRVKLPRAILELSLAVRSSVCKGSESNTFQKSVKFFGIFRTRKICSRLSGYFKKLKERTFLQAGCDSSGGVSRKGGGSTQHRKLVELDDVGNPKVTFDESLSQLATWVSSRRSCWQGQLTGLLGNLRLLSNFASVKERWAMVVQAGGVLSALIFLGRILIAGAVSSAAFTATASVFVVGLVLKFFSANNKLGLTALGKLWREPVSVGRILSPQDLWTIVEPFIRSGTLWRMLFGTSALAMIILVQLVASSWGPHV